MHEVASKNDELLQQPAFYPEFCSTSRPNVFSHQLLSTLSQQQQADAEDGTPCTSRRAFQHRSTPSCTEKSDYNSQALQSSPQFHQTTFKKGKNNLFKGPFSSPLITNQAAVIPKEGRAIRTTQVFNLHQFQTPVLCAHIKADFYLQHPLDPCKASS